MSRCFWILIVFLCLFAGCSKPNMPREYGYFRIDIPATHEYAPAELPQYPYTFLVSKEAKVSEVKREGEQYWIDIVYPRWNAAIHCSYKQVQGMKNFRMLSDDAQEFVYSHACKASAIPEREYADPEHRVFGLSFVLQGNTATPQQFYVTDSVKHFFRGSLYFNNVPNEDSVAPVAAYIQEDILAMIESFRWTR